MNHEREETENETQPPSGNEHANEQDTIITQKTKTQGFLTVRKGKIEITRNPRLNSETEYYSKTNSSSDGDISSDDVSEF